MGDKLAVNRVNLQADCLTATVWKSQQGEAGHRIIIVRGRQLVSEEEILGSSPDIS